MKTPVLLFSVDGMRPDALLRAKTPVMDRLIREGASTMKARTVMPSVTLPCHTSMLRGVDVPRHGITMNLFTPLARPVPSLMDVAAANGRRCAMFYNWGLLRDLCGPESVEFAYFVNDTASSSGDERVTAQACEHLVGDGLDFAFIYLGRTDQVGHDHGWMSEPYLAAIEFADACIGRVLAACGDAGMRPTVLVQSDHGGHERSHGTEMDEDMTIPWILYGPDVRQGHTLRTPVRIYDTCPTLASYLGPPMAPEWDGACVSEALDAARAPGIHQKSVPA